MLALSEKQKQTIQTLQIESYRQYCKVLGFDEVEHAKWLLSWARQRVNRTFGGIDLSKFQDGYFKSGIKKMIESDSFFDIRTAEFEIRRCDYAKMISSLISQLPVSYEYLGLLSHSLGLKKPTPDEPKTIEHFFEAIPLMFNWGFEFNAFVAGDSSIDGLPCVRIYEVLMTVCESFLYQVAPVAIDFADGKYAPLECCKAIGSSPAFMRQLENCFKLALGERISKLYSYAPENQAIENTVLCMTDGSIQAVWFHELGHLFQGHLEKIESHTLEFEADRFAFTILANLATTREMIRFWMGLGGITPLILIDIIERILYLKEGASHPSGNRRIEAILVFLNETNPRLAFAVRNFLRSLAAVCNPTLTSTWGITVEYPYDL